MRYEDGVRELTRLADSYWEIGRIADAIEPKYGDETLRKAAEESGHSYETLERCRTIWRAYPDERKNPSRLGNSFAVYVTFAGQSDRHELVQDKWTRAEARAEVAKRRSKKTNDKVAEEIRGKILAIGFGANDILTLIDDITDDEEEQEKFRDQAFNAYMATAKRFE